MSSKTKIHRFLRLTNDRGASDLHLSVGRPPMLRVSGEMEQVRYRVLRDADFIELLKPITPEAQWQAFEADGDADFSYEVPGVSRCRVNLFRQERGAGAVFRIIPSTIMTIEQLGLPQSIEKIVRYRPRPGAGDGADGLGQVDDARGGDRRDQPDPLSHIITIEDPIEFVHRNKRCLIHQREIGVHANSFCGGAAGRRPRGSRSHPGGRDARPRDHLHGSGRGRAGHDRLRHAPHEQRGQDRGSDHQRLSGRRAGAGAGTCSGRRVRAIVAQQLLPRERRGRVAAVEILFGSPALSGMIREGKTHQITSLIQTGSREGMIDMDAAIRRLHEEGKVTARAAYEKAIDKESFKGLPGFEEFTAEDL